nr:O-antigen ligase family protein [Lysinibacillus timonensis]
MTSFYGEYRDKNIISDEEENRVSRANVDKWIFRLFLVLIGFMPLIVLGHVEEVVSPVITDNSLMASGIKGDLFTHYKSITILTITIIIVLLFVFKTLYMNGTLKKTKLNYILGVFVIAIIVSTIFSPNITIALDGQYNRSDGGIMWLCYIALMFVAMNINYPQKAVNYVIFSLMPFIYINLYIITMNFYGNDLMQNQWMQNLVSIFLQDDAKIGESSQIVGTLNQWNYMSGMFAIMTVIFLTWAIIETSWVRSIIGLLTALVSLGITLMSISTSGFLTILVMLILLIWMTFKVDKKGKGTIIVVLFLVLSAPILHVLSKENSNVWVQSIGYLTQNNPYEKEQPVSSVSFKKVDLHFTLMNKVYAADNSFVLPVLPDRSLSAGSGRIYIWDKTIDLIKKRPALGYGLDSLMYNFPHFSIDARAGMADENVIVDKPHNTYIGILYGTGVIGFIGLIGVLFAVGITILKNLIGKVQLQYYVFAFASLAYFIQSMFNDSLQGISAVIWIFIGIMFAMNLYETDKKEIN